ncbi:MAG TPA: 50S ribosomal protein L11 methyltransferase [Solirubrobacterales bacterium]|nr:50S ribosomal protein L11 methyltransferase [Solirubrobacterales bacterium]
MIRLAVRCSPEAAEEVLAHLLELAPNGVEEERGPGFAEFAIYGPPGEVPELGELRAAAGHSRVDVTTTSVPDDWADRWADFHRPVVIGDRIRVRPSWWDAEDGPIDVLVDPGQAFGTGAHPTTRLCLELLIELERAGEAEGALADWGTGSAVLAIAAAKLGFSPVIACDREQAALEAATANAEANGVVLEIERVDVREAPPPLAPTVSANLTGPLLIECARRLAAVDRAPRTLVCSGMLETEAAEVAGAFAPLGLEPGEPRVEGDWAALLLRAS